MATNKDNTARQDATYVAPIVPKFDNVKEAFLSAAYKDYFNALKATADTHRIVRVPIPSTYRVENGTPTADFVSIDVRGTGSPIETWNPEFALLTAASPAGLSLIDKATGTVYKVLSSTSKDMVKNILVGEASNAVSKATTGKTVGEHVREVLSPLTPDVVSENTPEVVKSMASEALNPFYYGISSQSPFINELIRHTTGPHPAGIIPTARLAYHLNFDKPIFNTEPLLNVGWGPKQTIGVRHLSTSPIKKFNIFNPGQYGSVPSELLQQMDIPEILRQNPFGVWFSKQTESGTPRMTARKRLKSARARTEFQTRPYEITGDLVLEKPIVTIGDVSNREALEWTAERMGADGVIFNNIYDNGFIGTTSIKAQKQPINIQVKERPRIAYFGPTMGKSTYVKNNPNGRLVDFDRNMEPNPDLWGVRTKLAEALGIDPKDFGTNRVPEEIANSPQYKLALQEYEASILDGINAWVNYAENAGKILVTSNKYVLDPKNNVHLANTPSIPDFATFLERNQARGFRETPEQALDWWNSIISKNPNIRINNSFISDIVSEDGGIVSKAITRDFLDQVAPGTPEALKAQADQAREKALKGLEIVYKYINSPLYRQRLAAAFPSSEIDNVLKRLNLFIKNAKGNINTNFARKDITPASDSNRGYWVEGYVRTVPILKYRDAVQDINTYEPIELIIAYDCADPYSTAIHEAMHWINAGGKMQTVSAGPGGRKIITTPEVIQKEIQDYNRGFIPPQTGSKYEMYVNSPDKADFKEWYKQLVRTKHPEWTEQQVEDRFQTMITDGRYYNTEDEIRSYLLEWLLQAWDRGIIRNPNDETELLEFFDKRFDELPYGLQNIMSNYRNDLTSWAKYASKVLSTAGITLIGLKDKEVPEGKEGLKLKSIADELFGTQYIKESGEDSKDYETFANNIMELLTPADYIKAKRLGIAKEGIIRGVWQGGLKKVREVLNGKSYELLAYMK